MFIALPSFAATLNRASKPQDPIRILRLLVPLLGLALGISGCQAPVAAPAPSLTAARSLSSLSSAAAQVQSSPLYQQARQDCKKHDYRRAADALQALARTPGLAPEAAAFAVQQRTICLRDAGLPPPATPVTVDLPARFPVDADCGPRALLLVCQKLGVKTSVETLRSTAGTTAEGTTMAGLQQAAQKIGLKAEGVQVSREALPDTSPVAIAWMNRNHYAALLALSGRGDTATATIHDPNRPASETISQEQFLQRCGGFLLLVHR